MEDTTPSEKVIRETAENRMLGLAIATTLERLKLSGHIVHKGNYPLAAAPNAAHNCQFPNEDNGGIRCNFEVWYRGTSALAPANFPSS